MISVRQASVSKWHRAISHAIRSEPYESGSQVCRDTLRSRARHTVQRVSNTEAETFVLPAWAGAEVTGLRRYYNAALIAHPYNKWSDAERAGVDE